MSKLHFSVAIHAPASKVWDVMLNDQTYRQWTKPFHEGSHYEGSWDKGSDIRFLGPDENGQLGGMFSKIVENIPHQYISIEHLGEIINGQNDATTEIAKQWAGSHENYRFTQNGDVTKVDIELEGAKIDPEMLSMFKDMWPKALAKLKRIAEA